MEIFPVTGLLLLTIMCNSLSSGVLEHDLLMSDAPRRNHNRRSQRTEDDPGRPTHECATNRRVCDNFHADVQDLLNSQITEELKASYVYRAMANYFARDDVGLPGFAKFFHEASEEEHGHAKMMMEYMTKRGGLLTLNDISRPLTQEWDNGLEALRDALTLERHVNNRLLDLHWLAQQKNDPHLQDYLEGEFLTEQVDSIKQLGTYVTRLERIHSSPLAEYMFDKELDS